MTKQCKGCGKDFELTQETSEWFEKKGLIPPKRCESCRAKKRAQEHIEGKA